MFPLKIYMREEPLHAILSVRRKKHDTLKIFTVQNVLLCAIVEV